MSWQIISRALGLDAGGLVRSAIDSLWAAVRLDDGEPVAAHHSAAFTIAFISLAAKMAKADGVVASIEALTFDRLHAVATDEAANVRRVFDLAGGDSAGYETYAMQIRDALADEPRLLRDVLDALFHIAASDGVLHGREDVFLAHIAVCFGIPDAEFRAIRAAFVHGSPGWASGDDPYEVLGTTRSVGDIELKAHYRQLVRDHHPDSLMARGVPVEFHVAAERRLAVINAAFDEIAKERGYKDRELRVTDAVREPAGE